MTLQPLHALVTGVAGSAVSMASGLLAATGNGASEIVPWAQVGGTATAVGALAYVAKLLADGRLVAQPIAQMMTASERREATLTDLVEGHKAIALESHGREQKLTQLLLDQLARHRRRDEGDDR